MCIPVPQTLPVSLVTSVPISFHAFKRYPRGSGSMLVPANDTVRHVSPTRSPSPMTSYCGQVINHDATTFDNRCSDLFGWNTLRLTNGMSIGCTSPSRSSRRHGGLVWISKPNIGDLSYFLDPSGKSSSKLNSSRE